MELSLPNVRRFLIFSQKKTFLIFQKTESPKKFFYTPGTKLSYISGNGNTKKLLIFQKVTFRARKVKRTHS